jgi:hypothetical protein
MPCWMRVLGPEQHGSGIRTLLKLRASLFMTLRPSIGVLLVLAMLSMACNRHKQPEQAQSDVFDTQVAMRTMFGNFDPVIKSSLSYVPEDVAASNPNFVGKDQIRARPFFVQEVNENGVRKVYLLTWAKPAGQPFDCRGCAPLIYAAVFVRGTDGWKPESIGRAINAFGDFGKPPEGRLVQIGPQNYAFLMRVVSVQERTTAAEALLVPWKGTIQEAMRTVVADSNQGNCGGAYPCYSNQRELKFVPGADPQFSDILLTLTGTDMPQNPPYRTHDVSGTERLQFREGKYVHVVRQGDNISAEAEKRQ